MARRLDPSLLNSPDILIIHRNGTGLIGEIVSEVLGRFDFNEACLIRNWFLHDSFEFKTRVSSKVEASAGSFGAMDCEEQLSEAKDMNEGIDESSLVTVRIQSNIWQQFKREGDESKSRRLGQGATDFLSDKLQEIGFNCRLQSVFNRFCRRNFVWRGNAQQLLQCLVCYII